MSLGDRDTWTFDDHVINLHPSIRDILCWFEYGHLKPENQSVSRGFKKLAHEIAFSDKSNAEITTGLRKLLEAKDAVVRGSMTMPKITREETADYGRNQTE